jgi:hypothetical protein
MVVPMGEEMGHNKKPLIEWRIAEDDQEWQQIEKTSTQEQTVAGRQPSSLKRALLWRFGALMVVLFFLTASSGLAEHAPAEPSQIVQQPIAIATNELALDAYRLEWQAQVERKEGDLQTLGQDGSIPWYAATNVLSVETLGELAIVRVVHSVQGAQAYQEMRFYRRHPQGRGWMRTTPDDAPVGPQRRRESQYFTFDFHQHDAEAVTAVASQIDDLYLTLARNFGVSLLFSVKKLAVEISMTGTPGRISRQMNTDDPFIVPSPALSRRPVAITDAELIEQSLLFPLLDHLSKQSVEIYQIPGRWQPLLAGLRLWQLWKLDLPLSGWRDEVTAWAYRGLPDKGAAPSAFLPRDYEQLCAMHGLWMTSPLEIDIPLLCHDLDSSRTYASWSNLLKPPRRLSELQVAELPCDVTMMPSSESCSSYPSKTIALATLFDYAAVAYGPQRIPALPAQLRMHEGWETLVPAVFGVSAADFEMGWQAYLAEQYEIEPNYQSTATTCRRAWCRRAWAVWLVMPALHPREPRAAH